ncbi:hypothetical protein RhiirC2_794404 [Rhizophagus irregularis]|uniref:Uncharacterized protein n=1 Tax=Rhizophagus irregularis TaxID=588596 RepID=A0A2N1MDM2_9GLOM|nr:hypothetical protein RhiirC2_794404 [Rhizophagus irregularis]
MASEPLGTTISNEPLTSTSEIQTDTSESFQLEVLALNYLQNQEISTIPIRILKLNPCRFAKETPENQANSNNEICTTKQESESQSRRNSSKRGLLQGSLGKKAKNVDEEEDADGSVSQSLA